MFKISTAFLDIFLILTFRFILLWVMSMLLINPAEQKEETPDPKAEFLVKVTWENDTNCDVDTWMTRDGIMPVCGFKSREVDCFILQNDHTSMYYGMVEDKTKEEACEVLSITSKVEDTFRLALHGYAVRNDEMQIEANITIEQVNPYKEIYSGKVMVYPGQETPVISFEIDEDEKVVNIETDEEFLENILGG